MNRIVLLLGVLLLAAAFLACARANKPVESTPSPEPASQASRPAGKEAWETEWEKVLSGAKREGNLMVYAWYGSELSRPVSKIFKERFGVNIEWMTIRGPEMAEKVFRERKAGLYLSDLTLHGTGTGLNTLKPAGATEPLDGEFLLPENLDGRNWMAGKLPFVDRDRHLAYFRTSVNTVLTANAEIMRKEDMSSYRDLLNPRWKGKILWDDPTVNGPGSFFFRIIGLKYMGLDWLREMVKQEPILIRDRRLAVEWLARGRYPVGLGLDTQIVAQYQDAGSPLLQFNAREGGYVTSGGGNLYIFKNAPHPMARRLFVNWFLSREGQTVYTQNIKEQSSREDVPISHLDPDSIRRKDLPLFNSVSEEFQMTQAEELLLAKEIFGPLLK